MVSRRQFVGGLGVAGLISLPGCSDTNSGTAKNNSDEPTAGGKTPADGNTPAEEVVANYYTAAADGDLQRAGRLLALTEVGGDGGSVEQIMDTMRGNGMSENGADATIGAFNELSADEFAEFTFQSEDGEQQDVTVEQAEEWMMSGAAFGADADELAYIHHTGGFNPEVWVLFQPTQENFTTEYPNGWGEVIIEVGTFGDTQLLIGDFRTYTDLKVISD